MADHVRRLILDGRLLPGEKLPTERDLGHYLSLSRTSVRAGLQALASKGVLTVRHGAGTFVADDLLRLDDGDFRERASLCGAGDHDMSEARRVLASAAAGLAAMRASGHALADISDAVSGMFASTDRPAEFHTHDADFHDAVARASGNPILAAMLRLVSKASADTPPGAGAPGIDLVAAAQARRQIYRAIRRRDAALASRQMSDHLRDRTESEVQTAGSDAAAPVGEDAALVDA